MTLKEAIEAEIASQGISPIDISRDSGVSKATIYNILNGTTDDPRIRLSTKRAIAEGCGKGLRVLSDGGVEFVPPGGLAPDRIEPVSVSHLRLRYASGRPFLADGFCRDVFDWVHDLETSGRIPPCDVVNRVFQRRSDFLSLVCENLGDSSVTRALLSIRISIPDSRVQRTFSVTGAPAIPPLGSGEMTLFLSEASFDFDLEIPKVTFQEADGEPCAATWEPDSTGLYRFRRG